MRWFLQQSYSQSFIWMSVGATLLIGVLLARILGLLVDPRHPQYRVDREETISEFAPIMSWSEDDIRERLEDRAEKPAELLELAIDLQFYGSGEQRLWALNHWPTSDDPSKDPEMLERGSIDTVGPLILSSPDGTVGPELKLLAIETPPQRWSNRAIGDFMVTHDQRKEALEHYVREGSHFPDAEHSRSMAWFLAQQFERTDLIDNWREQELWADQFGPHAHMDHASRTGDFWALLRWLLPSMYQDFDLIMTLIATVAAAIWFSVLFHASHGVDRRLELVA